MNKQFIENQTKRNLLKNSASFLPIVLLSIFIILGCKKKTFNNGKDNTNAAYDITSAMQKEYDLTTYSIKEDSIRCKNPARTLFGSYTDPIFGQMNASIYSNFLLENPGSTNFTSSQTIDSVVLSLQYNGYYGYTGDLNISVFELYEDISKEDQLYQFSFFDCSSTSIVESGYTIVKPKPQTKVIAGGDTLSPQLRIRLKNSFGKQLIDGVEQGYYETQSKFKDFFKGLYITTNTTFPEGKGAIYYFNMTAANTRITIYYKDDQNNSKSFKYIVNNTDGVFFNHVDKVITGTKLSEELADTTKGSDAYYAQAYGIRSIIKIPQFKNIPKNSLVHKAQITLPYTSYYSDQYYPSASVTLGYYENDDLNKPITIKKGILYNTGLKAFVFDLNDYSENVIVAQNILDGIINTETFFIIPDNYANSAERIIFNGKNTTYKIKPNLKLIYTEN